MTVADLIARLRKMPQDITVLRADNSGGYEALHTVSKTEVTETRTSVSEDGTIKVVILGG